MRLRILLFPAVLALLAVATSWAENPVKAKIPDAKTAAGKHYTVEFEDQFVRVLCHHSVTVFLTGGNLKMTMQDGRTFIGTVPKGKVVWEEVGPIGQRTSAETLEAVRIQLKSPPAGDSAT